MQNLTGESHNFSPANSSPAISESSYVGGNSMTPQFAEMLGQENKQKQRKPKQSKKQQSQRLLVSMIDKQPGSNTNLKRQRGPQQLPTNLKESMQKNKRYALFFRRVIQDKKTKRQPTKNLLSLLKENAKKMLHEHSTSINMKRIDTFNPLNIPNGAMHQKTKTSLRIDDISEDRHKELEEEEDMMSMNERLSYERSFLVLFPDSQLRAFWDLFSFLFILYQSLMLPFKITFEPTLSQEFVYVDLFQDCFFLMDVVLNFSTGIISKGLLEEAQTVKNPIYRTPRLLRLFKIARMLKMLKLLRVFKVQKYLMKVEEHIVTDFMNMLITFFQLALKIIFISHWLACFFWSIGKNCMDDVEICWINDAGVQDDEVVSQYTTSLYWAFTTMITVGYGDITPMTTNERLYAMVAMIVASASFSFTLNTISTLVSRYNLLARNYKEKMNFVTQFMLSKQVPGDLRMRIRRYLEYVWESKKEIKIDEKEVMAMLNQNLREKITVYLNGRILQKMIFFEPFGLDLLSITTFHNVYQEGDESKHLYNIVQGKTGMIHKASYSYFIDLGVGDNFGEIGFFTDNPRLLSAKSRDYCELYCISKRDFVKVAEDYINGIQAYHTIRSSLIDEKNYYIINIKCYICGRKGHVALTCQFFHNRKGNLRKAFKKLQVKSFKEDFLGISRLPSLSFSYIYEEDHPEKNRAAKLGGLVLDRQVCSSKVDTDVVIKKNKLLREAYFQSTVFHQEEDLYEMVFNEDVEDKTVVDTKLRHRLYHYKTSHSRISLSFTQATQPKRTTWDSTFVTSGLTDKLERIKLKNTYNTMQVKSSSTAVRDEMSQSEHDNDNPDLDREQSQHSKASSEIKEEYSEYEEERFDRVKDLEHHIARSLNYYGGDRRQLSQIKEDKDEDEENLEDSSKALILGNQKSSSKSVTGQNLPNINAYRKSKSYSILGNQQTQEFSGEKPTLNKEFSNMSKYYDEIEKSFLSLSTANKNDSKLAKNVNNQQPDDISVVSAVTGEDEIVEQEKPKNQRVDFFKRKGNHSGSQTQTPMSKFKKINAADKLNQIQGFQDINTRISSSNIPLLTSKQKEQFRSQAKTKSILEERRQSDLQVRDYEESSKSRNMERIKKISTTSYQSFTYYQQKNNYQEEGKEEESQNTQDLDKSDEKP
ncbi:UNKNOWN [Stylonychia lemnae]|uniref:Cation channel family protein n=1 Tax=Stylonychia lemnae TaxID=5949 RepID=A0A078AHV6_STYLE|nr:UNKNOWN [Stylonychia lemnae]|eukprot:CDW81481.1 UNKNOWN [Stylonychia lemnae]